MRIFTSEFAHDYGTFSFGYTIHAALDENDALEKAYDAGFLPYSGNPKPHSVLYMVRSVRVPLASFDASSENRRVLRKFEGEFVTKLLDHETLVNDEEFHALFLTYFKERHGNVVDRERLDAILASKLPLQGIRYETRDGRLIAVVLEVANAAFSHFWFSAYDLSYINASLGMWLMLDGVRRAQASGQKYIYLGTAYGEKALYKLNVATIEFWDGQKWNTDIKDLKERVKNDFNQSVTCGTRFDSELLS